MPPFGVVISNVVADFEFDFGAEPAGAIPLAVARKRFTHRYLLSRLSGWPLLAVLPGVIGVSRE